MTGQPLTGVADPLFADARTANGWQDRPVTDDTLRAVYDRLKWGPTSANSSPARFIFVRSPDAKEKLRPALSAGNLAKTMAAPVTVIVAHDPGFPELLPHLYPGADARSWFAGNPVLVEETAFRNGSLQGAYLIIAARAAGLDAGPMSGFDKSLVESAFLAAHGWRANFLVNLGYADPAGTRPRAPRLTFDEACTLL